MTATDSSRSSASVRRCSRHLLRFRYCSGPLQHLHHLVWDCKNRTIYFHENIYHLASWDRVQ
jgi:hypothetical protein